MATFQNGDIVRWTKKSGEWTVKNEFSAQRKYWIQHGSDNAFFGACYGDIITQVKKANLLWMQTQ